MDGVHVRGLHVDVGTMLIGLVRRLVVTWHCWVFMRWTAWSLVMVLPWHCVMWHWAV